MPFEKNNKIWQESHKSRLKNKDRLGLFFEIIADGGITEYANKLDQLSRKEKLTDEEKEFMDRFEGWREFIAPKLSRTESKSELNVNVKDLKGKTTDDLIKYLNE